MVQGLVSTTRTSRTPRNAAAAALLGAMVSIQPAVAKAQSGGSDAAPTTSVTPSGGGGESVTVVTLPPAPAQTTSGADAPDVNAHLPSSSKASSDISSSQDGFDLKPSSAGATVVRGGEKGAYVVSGQYVPDVHTAKRGDTLWDISNKYFHNPYQWPRVWSYNKRIQNPHWIYPGDHIRLRGDWGVRKSHIGFAKPQREVRPDAVFVPNVGFVEDGTDPYWGEIVGSPGQNMILAENDQVYVELEDKYHVSVGQKLTVLEPMDVDNLAGAEFVYIRGVVEVNRYNPKTHMARGRIIQSRLPIERGARVAPLDTIVDRVEPTRNEKTIHAQVIGSLYPNAFYAQHGVVFIDKGKEDGVKVGNRFFAVWRGDRWRQNLKTAGRMADMRAITEDDRNARVEETPDNGDEDLYPVETYGELVVLRVRDETATCLVTASLREIPRGAAVVARQGY